jgi:general secretion pathway protein K
MRLNRSGVFSSQQRGVAIVTALLVVVLSTVLVSGVIWRIYKVSRSVQNEAAKIQARQVMQSAIEWASVILREDARVSSTDTLAEPWAVPLADTRLNESLKPQISGTDNNTNARLSGDIEDAQARFNLFNLTQTGTAGDKQVKAFYRLSALMGLSRSMSETIVKEVRRAKTEPVQRLADLKREGGIDQNAIDTLERLVVWLPVSTKVNANTARAEVLYSVMSPLNYAVIQQLLGTRDRASFKDEADFRSRIPGGTAGGSGQETLSTDMIDVKSQFFLVKGRVQVQESRLKAEALIQREGNKVYTLWRQD